MKRLLATLAMPFVITACGSDDDQTQGNTVIPLDFGDAYSAQLEISEVLNASAEVSVSITAKDGQSTQGQTVSLLPNMAMVAGHAHSTPMADESGELDEKGTFTTKAYFLMPTHSSDGEIQGNWSFEISFNDETVIAPFTVEMDISDRKMLRGIDDKISGMSGPMARPYFLYSEGRHVMDSGDHFTVYVATREYMTKHTSLVDGIDLVGSMPMQMPMMAAAEEAPDYTLDNLSASVKMCAQDCDLDISWEDATPVQGMSGQYRASNIGLNGNDTDTVLVQLTVNDEVKTTSGTAEGTAYVTFTFDGASESSDMSHSM